ncbi:tRNA (adenosine(37)-N6)-threonylcarbamoyltransferase complex ATPase subunit type 1 TsaE [Streptomyces sparsogenes]|uniref:tRNA (adenosine(37)-N6)-threonylcarbamoyltransferase complex ATPase subunit type 1 TsaE n=1 Tax=Streptomyces sparsogenes TaxID=67365 RepID=UPI0033C6D911
MDIPHVTDPHTVATRLTVTSPEQMRDLGRRLAKLLRPGDLVLLTGELGAGKTTLTRGLGEGLGVRGAVTSPTFVIARVHPSLGDGPPLVHVDAYRLGGGLDEMEDLDLDVSLPDSVVAVEWGEGKVEGLAEDRLHVVIERTVGAQAGGQQAAGGQTDGEQTDGEQTAGEQAAAPEEDVRRVVVTGVGPRWAGEDLAALAG